MWYPILPQFCLQDTSNDSLVTELRVDVVSLPHLAQLGLYTQCSQVQKVQLDFTRDVTIDDVKTLKKFSSATKVYLTAYR